MIASAQQRWQDRCRPFSIRVPCRRRGAKPAQHAGTDGLPARKQSILRWHSAGKPGRQSTGRGADKAAGGSSPLCLPHKAAPTLEQSRTAEAEGQAQEQLRRFLSLARATNRKPSRCSIVASGWTRTRSYALARRGLSGSCSSAQPLRYVSQTSWNRSVSSPPSFPPIRSPPNSPAAENSAWKRPAIKRAKTPGPRTAPGSSRHPTLPWSTENGRQWRHRSISECVHDLY